MLVPERTLANINASILGEKASQISMKIRIFCFSVATAMTLETLTGKG
jgi:hypothetical protein